MRLTGRLRDLFLFLLLLTASCSESGSSLVPVPATAASGSTAAGSSASPVVASILRPTPGTQVPYGTSVQLEGTATANGKPVADLSWHSSLDGLLGRGRTVRATGLSAGLHQIRLEARDPAGHTGEDRLLLAVAGPGTKSGEDLLSLLGSLPQRLLGNPPRIPDARTLIDNNPTRVNGAVGNGGLTAGVGRDGTVTVLRWPSPSYHDQVDHLTTDRNAPRMGAAEDMGIFAGLRVPLPSGPVVTWFRDKDWKTIQTYLSDEDNILVTVHEHAALDLKVTETLLIHPDRDVLSTRFEVSAGPAAPVKQVDLIYFENLAPCTTKIPFLPFHDWLLDVLNDYALFYHAGDDALVHFRPKKANYKPLLSFAATQHANVQKAADAFVDGATATLGSGVALAIGGDRPSTAFTCGTDSAGVIGAPSSRTVRTAFEEVSSGTFSKTPYALIRASGALARTLDLSGGSDTWSVHVAAGADPDQARTELTWARSRTFADHLSDTHDDWANWLARATLPNTSDKQALAFCKRTLISIRTATDKQSGAIVASIATQPPYSLDWPRDGAFINRVLDEAGYLDMVARHNRFYAKVQRKGGIWRGSTDMNYYADGTAGGPIPFEIDEAALTVWTLWDHATFMTNAQKKARYLKDVYPAIKRGADLLVRWRDPLTRLPLPANEDDNINLTQGLQGSGTAVLALDSAIAAGRATGEKGSVIRKWTKRRDELKKAILNRFWFPQQQTFTDFGPKARDAAAWVIWPVSLLPLSDGRITKTATTLHRKILPVLNKTATRGGYEAKIVLSLAHAWRGKPQKMTEVRRLVNVLTHEIPTEGTNHVGEWYDIKTVGGKRVFENINNVPHVWEHSLIYLAVLEANR